MTAPLIEEPFKRWFSNILYTAENKSSIYPSVIEKSVRLGVINAEISSKRTMPFL